MSRTQRPAGGTDPDRVSGRGAQAGVCFLLVTLTNLRLLKTFAQAKKSNSLKERKLLILILL